MRNRIGLGGLGTFALVLAVPFLLYAIKSTSVGAEQSKSDQLNSLLKDRLVTVEEIYNLIVGQYKSGETSYDQVMAASASVLGAKLDLCDTREQRIDIHREMVGLAQENQKTVEQRFKTNEVTRADMLKAKANWLEAKISLERAIQQ